MTRGHCGGSTSLMSWRVPTNGAADTLVARPAHACEAFTTGVAGYAGKMPVGAELGRYRRISRIGSGGMATVDLAEDTRLGRRVALKRMGGTVDVNGLSRLRREALAGASLNHPNLVSVYDILTLEDGDLVIVMEYVEGETLRDRVARDGALGASDALPILAGVAAGLDAIHGAGIVHRDVKPSNILLGSDGAVKVADLGVASVPDRTQITTAGSIIGSLSYMAPEQLEEGPATPAIDIYALSAVAFEVLSGVKARDAPNPVALAHMIATQPPPNLSDAWPAAPAAATDVLRRGMSRAPRERPASAAELVAELEAGLSGPATRRPARAERASPPPIIARSSPPVIERESRQRTQPVRTPPDGDDDRRRWYLAALALGLVGLAVVLIVVLSQGSTPTPKRAASGAKTRPHHSRSHRSTSHASTATPPASHSQSASATTTSSATSSATTTASASAPAQSGSSSTPAGSTAPGSTAAPPSSSSAGTPSGAVESFYQLANARRYSEAWALADPTFRAQLGGYQSFQAGQANDRSITFDSAHVASQTSHAATVAVTTTSVQSTKTSHCAGTVDLVPGAPGQWLLHQIHINCS